MDDGGGTGRDGGRVPAAQARGALLGTFVGDALGARWEGAPTSSSWRDAHDRLDASARQSTLVYTDDTQMMLALAEHLTTQPGVDIPTLAQAFVDHYEPGRGYGGGTVRVLRALRHGEAVDRAARAGFSDGSLGNGAAMRAAPVGVVWAHNEHRLVEVARRSALPTHVHPEGIDGAVMIAAAVGRAGIQGRFTAEDVAALARQAQTDAVRGAVEQAAGMAGEAIPDPPEVARRLGVSATAARSTATALWIAATASDPVEAVRRALALGGDADTIAAMATAVVAAAAGEDALPDAWLHRCEDGPRGRSWCVSLADRLAA